MLKKTLVAVGCSLISGAVFAHVGVVPKEVADLYDGRNYKEGTSTFLNLSIPHGCGDEDTIGVVAVMPNSTPLTGIAFTSSGDSKFPANAIMSAKPVTDPGWKKITRNDGTVPAFGSGNVTVDTKSIWWGHGVVPHDFYGIVTFRATLPKLDGCVSTLKINVPVMQYCKNQTGVAWTGEATSRLPESIINPGYYPSFTVVRDTTANPLPAECNGVGTTATATPSNSDIDASLPPAHEFLIENSIGEAAP